MEFTFNPTLSLTVSGDLVIDELVPGSSKSSNSIDVTVSTNNVYGYNLSATVGNSSTYNTRALVHSDSSSSTPTISSIDYHADSSAYISELGLDSNNNGTWGYSINNGNSYNGLPLYNDTTNVAILNGSIVTPANGTATTSFLIGAKASPAQPSGEYSNIINFYAVTNVPPATFSEAFAAAGKQLYKGYYKMQDMSSDICNAVEPQGNNSIAQLIDTRDDEVYYINKLADGRCWLLDNLRLGGTEPITLTPENTNIISEFTLPASTPYQKTLYTDPLLSSNYENNITNEYGSGSKKEGVYYNYCAASGGTYCYDMDSGTRNLEHDICPSGWKIPGTRNGELEKLYTTYNSDFISIVEAISVPIFNDVPSWNTTII